MSQFFKEIGRRRILLRWAGILLGSVWVALAWSQSPLSAIASDPVMIAQIPAEVAVATEDDYPPFDFLQEGKHVGYNQDLLEAVAKEAGFKFKQEILPFQGILAGVASGKYTATNSAIGITAKRAESVDFTMPITELTNFYLKRKGDTSISSIKDFADKNVGVQQGGITAAVMESAVKPELAKSGAKVGTVKEYGAFAEAYQDLTNKRIDIVINNIIALKKLVSEKPDLYEIGTQVGPKVYASWAVKKGNKAMLDALNLGLGKAKSSGMMKQLQEKWLKVSFELPDKPTIPAS